MYWLEGEYISNFNKNVAISFWQEIGCCVILRLENGFKYDSSEISEIS